MNASKNLTLLSLSLLLPGLALASHVENCTFKAKVAGQSKMATLNASTGSMPTEAQVPYVHIITLKITEANNNSGSYIVSRNN